MTFSLCKRIEPREIRPRIDVQVEGVLSHLQAPTVHKRITLVFLQEKFQ